MGVESGTGKVKKQKKQNCACEKSEKKTRKARKNTKYKKCNFFQTKKLTKIVLVGNNNYVVDNYACALFIMHACFSKIDLARK